MGYLYQAVYLVGDFHHKSDMEIGISGLRAQRHMQDNPGSGDSEDQLRKTTMPETLL